MWPKSVQHKNILHTEDSRYIYEQYLTQYRYIYYLDTLLVVLLVLLVLLFIDKSACAAIKRRSINIFFALNLNLMLILILYPYSRYWYSIPYSVLLYIIYVY